MRLESLVDESSEVLDVMHHVDEVVAEDDVRGHDGGAGDPADEPDEESQHEESHKDPADDAAALVHLALLPVVGGGASNDTRLYVWINVHREKILFYFGNTHTYTPESSTMGNVMLETCAVVSGLFVLFDLLKQKHTV